MTPPISSPALNCRIATNSIVPRVTALLGDDVNMTATNGRRSFVTACRGENRSALQGRPGPPLFASPNRGGIIRRAGWRARRENSAEGWAPANWEPALWCDSDGCGPDMPPEGPAIRHSSLLPFQPFAAGLIDGERAVSSELTVRIRKPLWLMLSALSDRFDRDVIKSHAATPRHCPAVIVVGMVGSDNGRLSEVRRLFLPKHGADWSVTRVSTISNNFDWPSRTYGRVRFAKGPPATGRCGGLVLCAGYPNTWRPSRHYSLAHEGCTRSPSCSAPASNTMNDDALLRPNGVDGNPDSPSDQSLFPDWIARSLRFSSVAYSNLRGEIEYGCLELARQMTCWKPNSLSFAHGTEGDGHRIPAISAGSKATM